MTNQLRQRDRRSDSLIIGNSEPVLKLRKMIDMLAPGDLHILILGENGTGKELVARLLYQKSSRPGQPFIGVNMASLSENLVDSELFGHKKGAFTGATVETTGLFEAADGGIIFLDEIGDLPLSAQAKILRAIEYGEIRKTGSNTTKIVDVRTISATNKDLDKAIQEGTFRRDLYFRLNAARIDVPPLRERKEDIPLLVSHFLEKARCKQAVGGISKAALDLLMDYSFPGNIRELKNIIEWAVTMAQGAQQITLDHLPEYLTGGMSKEPDVSSGRVRSDALLEALKAITRPSEQGFQRPWHETLRYAPIEKIYEFLVKTDGMGFSWREFSEYLNRQGGGGTHSCYATAGRYLRIMMINRILEHNGKRANAARYLVRTPYLDGT